MAEELKAELCVIGAGAAGLAAAGAAAALGVPVILIEKGRMGGEHLNTGCVPSKAMLAAGRRAECVPASGAFGIEPAKPAVVFDEVNDHVHRIINAVGANASKERLGALHVRVIEGEARFPRQPHGRSRPGRGRPVRGDGPPLRDRHRLQAPGAGDFRPRPVSLFQPTRRSSRPASGRST